MIFSQVKVSGDTLEYKAQDWLQTSSIAVYLQKVAQGGVKALKNGSTSLTSLVKKNVSGIDDTQRASRMDFNFSRSPNAIKEKSTKEYYDESE